MLCFDDFTGGNDVACLAPEATAFDEREKLFKRSFSHGVRIRPAGENSRGDFVHLFVSALGREHGGYEHLIRIIKNQFGFRVRIHLFQFFQNSQFLLFLQHQIVLNCAGIRIKAFQTRNRIRPFTGNWIRFFMTRVHTAGQKASLPGAAINPVWLRK